MNGNVEVSFWFRRRVLVTGGPGFIGSHLVRRLVALGSGVVSVGGSRKESDPAEGARYVYGDLARDTLELTGMVPETVFHLAGGSAVAASLADPPDDFLKTAYSSVVLLDYLRQKWPETELVFLSSAAVYGEARHKRASHSLACLPISPYGLHKRLVEGLLLDHARMYRIRSAIVRAFSVYGPGLRKQLLWDAMEKAGRGAFEFFGSGRELRDWVYVADLVECLLRAARRASPDVPVYNAGTCKGVSVREVLTELFQIAGFDREPAFPGQHKEGDPSNLVAEDSAEDALGPLFRTPLRDGLAEYVKWYRSARQI